MTEATTGAAPTPEQLAAAHEAGAALAASTLADLIVLIDGADLLTLTCALEAEQAKGDGARKGAVAALESAIAGHPELAAAAAAGTDEVPALVASDIVFIADAPRDLTVEAAATAEIAEAGAELVPMSHPDGGTCDRYDTDADGHILVPIVEIAEMAEHGFVVVAA